MTTAPDPPRRIINFAGRRWWVKRAREPFGPGPNRFDDSIESVDVDADGALVMRIRRRDDHWVCAEVIGEEITGYGRYHWTLRTDLADLDRHVVLGMFTWSEQPGQSNRELDIEVSGWSCRDRPVGTFVVQPSVAPSHVQTFTVPRTASWACSFDWSPGRVAFRAGDEHAWTFTGDCVPTPGGAQPRINLWLHEGRSPYRNSPVTVTVGNFGFTPLSSVT